MDSANSEDRSEPEKLRKAIQIIDEANAQDPTLVDDDDGNKRPYRLVYSEWLTDLVYDLTAKPADELVVLARGKSIESWKLSSIRRDDYAPNSVGQKQWEYDRKKWVAKRLSKAAEDAGYSTGTLQLLEDMMMEKNIPNPRDIRLYDLQGAFGMINYRLLEIVWMKQVLMDAEALLFLQRNFTAMFDRLPADEVQGVLARELRSLSDRSVIRALNMGWTPVQRRLLARALPKPSKYNHIMLEAEGMAAASTHPGDWRYKGFDYE